MNIDQLRAKHPRLVYQSYEITEASQILTISFHFLLEPDIAFSPQVTIPTKTKVNRRLIERLVFNLGMIEAISYWKAACPPELVVEAGNLTNKQTVWWHDLYLNGLGEFFYKNHVDFTQPDFLKISSTSRASRASRTSLNGSLVLVGGGKDSAVTLELLKKLPGRKAALLLNPTPAPLKIIETAGYEGIIVHRTIDKKLLELNGAGYLNGHTPFSAYLAFLGTLVAAMNGYQHIIASNEASASEGNVEYLGKAINHQYSKSFDFEKKFREYSKGNPEYFSLLRPLGELQVAALFANMPKYHHVFASCNVSRGNGWCGACAKCAFVYLALSPFLPLDAMKKIFGSEFFEKQELQKHFLDLTGAGDLKPFECVGTPEDVQGAIALLAGEHFALARWDTHHFLPQSYEEVLRLATSRNVLLLGYGRENQSVERYLIKHYPHIAIGTADQKTDGPGYLSKIKDFDTIIRTPGIPAYKISGLYVTTATNIFFSVFPGVTIGVTGTKGKSTTAALIADILRQKFSDVRICGNIGNPALDALKGATADTLFVVELSSHQLEDARFSPHIAVVLNVFSEHMDYYKNFDQYVAAKANIIAYQTGNDTVVYDDTNKTASKLAQNGRGKKVPISKTKLDGNDINVRAAIAVAELFHIPKKQILRAVKTFQTLPHRLEFIGEFKGIRFYNDSLATVPEATMRALATLGNDVTTLIAGGFDRGLDYTKLGEFLAKRKSLQTLILFPDTGKKIWKSILAADPSAESRISKLESRSMQAAVSLAYQHTPPGKICLLSPAAASFNLFRDYADRGEQFKKWVALDS